MLQTVSGTFSIDALQLEYLHIIPPRPERLTLVFLHEGLGCVALWKGFPQQVAAHTACPVLVYSRAGYGASDPCPLPRPLTFMHDEALRVLPQLLSAAAVEQALLIGHSDGASIALIAAGGRQDVRLQGLVLMAPHVFVEELTLASIRDAAAAYANTGLRQRLKRYHGSNVDIAFFGWNRAWLDPHFISWNLEHYLPQISIPVLCIQGLEDNYGSLRQLDKISAGLPQPATRLLLPDCGHSPFHDQPELTLHAVVNFVQHCKTESDQR